MFLLQVHVSWHLYFLKKGGSQRRNIKNTVPIFFIFSIHRSYYTVTGYLVCTTSNYINKECVGVSGTVGGDAKFVLLSSLFVLSITFFFGVVGRFDFCFGCFWLCESWSNDCTCNTSCSSIGGGGGGDIGSCWLWPSSASCSSPLHFSSSVLIESETLCSCFRKGDPISPISVKTSSYLSRLRQRVDNSCTSCFFSLSEVGWIELQAPSGRNGYLGLCKLWWRPLWFRPRP